MLSLCVGQYNDVWMHKTLKMKPVMAARFAAHSMDYAAGITPTKKATEKKSAIAR